VIVYVRKVPEYIQLYRKVGGFIDLEINCLIGAIWCVKRVNENVHSITRCKMCVSVTRC